VRTIGHVDTAQGYKVRLLLWIYETCVRRSKIDAAEATAICEAVEGQADFSLAQQSAYL